MPNKSFSPGKNKNIASLGRYFCHISTSWFVCFEGFFPPSTILNHNYDIVLDTNLPGMLQTASAVWRILSLQTGHWDTLPPLTLQWREGRYGVVSHNDCSFESAGTQRHRGVGCWEWKAIINQFNRCKVWHGVFMNTLFFIHFLKLKYLHIFHGICQCVSEMPSRAVSVQEDNTKIFCLIFCFDINLNIKLKDISKDTFIHVCLKEETI